MSYVILAVFLMICSIDFWRGSWRDSLLEMRLRGPRGLLRAADEEQQR